MGGEIMRVFDLHCDTLTRCKRKGWSLDGRESDLRLSDAKDFDAYLQLYAIFIPDEVRGERAQQYFSIHHLFYRRQLEEAAGQMYDVRTLRSLRAAPNKKGRMSSILAVEGGSVLNGELDMVQTLANAGVRSMTLTWNGENELAGGAASEEGLSDFGRAAIREMERLHIAVDVSHLNDRSFYDVIETAEVPVIATHSNSRAVCDHRRNLTDEMFCLIAQKGGIVGLNFCRDFIADGGKNADLTAMAEHVEHFLELGGENAIALGSDYDGADIDPCIDRPSKLRDLHHVLLERGWTQEQLDKLFFNNALNYFDRLIAGEW